MPPENAGYMVAAYVVTAVVLVGYAVLLIRRATRALKRLDGKT
jgi:CcmD family protein